MKYDAYTQFFYTLFKEFDEVTNKYEWASSQIQLNELVSSQLFFCEQNISLAFLNTTNDVYLRELPFKNIFIDDILQMPDKFPHLKVLGICICSNTQEDVEQNQSEMEEATPSIKEDVDKLLKSGEMGTYYDDKLYLWVEYVILHPSGEVTPRTFRILKDGIDKDEYADERFGGDSPSKSFFKKLDNMIATYVCNFIDFINQPSTTTIRYPLDNAQNQKRVSKGKIPLPATSIIRLSPEHVIYLKRLETQERMPYSHKFIVRGHWMNFYHKRYKNRERVWIKPFFKGEGLFVRKEYLLTGGSPKKSEKPQDVPQQNPN